MPMQKRGLQNISLKRHLNLLMLLMFCRPPDDSIMQRKYPCKANLLVISHIQFRQIQSNYKLLAIVVVFKGLRKLRVSCQHDIRLHLNIFNCFHFISLHTLQKFPSPSIHYFCSSQSACFCNASTSFPSVLS